MTARLGAWCAIATCAASLACGGRAADGLLPDGSGPTLSDGSDPDDGSDPILSDEPERGPGDLVRPRRETCEDNPLLAGCPRPDDVCRDSPQGPGCSPESEPAPAPAVDEPLEIEIAEDILGRHCGGCHGTAYTPSQASASFNYVNDWDRLIDVGLIVTCSPERSRIIELMRAGDMPPPNSGLPPVSDADIAIVEDAINLDCTLE